MLKLTDVTSFLVVKEASVFFNDCLIKACPDIHANLLATDTVNPVPDAREK